MDLSALFREFPNFSLASEADEAELLTQIREKPMQIAGMELFYERDPEFVKLLRYQAEQFFTVIAKRENKIKAFASFSLGERLIGGEIKKVLYAGDFRASLDRKIAGLWRKFYTAFLHTQKVDYVLTAVLAKNAAANRALVNMRHGFYYHPIKTLTMANVLAKKPFRKNSNARVLNGLDFGEERLRSFLEESQKSYLFGYRFDREAGNEWDRRQKIWPGFAVNNFLVAVDADGQPLAICLPWSPQEAKRMRVGKMNCLYRGVGIFFHSVPRPRNIFSTLYLSHLSFSPLSTSKNRQQAIHAFLDHLYNVKANRQYNLISFADSESLHKELPFLFQCADVNLYLVSTEKNPPVLPPDPIFFEMGLV